ATTPENCSATSRVRQGFPDSHETRRTRRPLGTARKGPPCKGFADVFPQRTAGRTAVGTGEGAWIGGLAASRVELAGRHRSSCGGGFSRVRAPYDSNRRAAAGGLCLVG